MPPVIVLEFNELTPALMNKFIDQGHLPYFKQLRSESITCITDAEEEPPALEPWIQWVTVHTGLSFSEHGVYDLGEGESFRAPRIWDLVAEAGERSWICGSMNATIQDGSKDHVYLLPDPWAIRLTPKPEGHFSDFYRFIRTYVQEYTRERPPLAPNDYLRFVKFMLMNGLSLQTIMMTARQLGMEKFSGAARWRRAMILDRLLWDVFRHTYRKTRPRFSTFFLNSTAHLQHYYWRDMDPEGFLIRPDAKSTQENADAILLGYKAMDRIVGECISLAGSEAAIVMCTALGQQPMIRYDSVGGKQPFKPRNPSVLLRFANYTGSFEYSPVMAEQFNLLFEREEEAIDAEEKLSALKLQDRPLMDVRRDGKRVFSGCKVLNAPPADAEVTTHFSNKAAKFDVLFYPADSIKSGMHHPDGLLWIRTPSRVHREIDRKVSLREVAPTLVRLCSINGESRFSSPPLPELNSAL